jgi:hypothetical protein
MEMAREMDMGREMDRGEDGDSLGNVDREIREPTKE